MMRISTVLLPARLGYLRDLLTILVMRDLKARYKDSVLGMFWTVLQPLLFLLVFYFIFKLVLTLDIQRFTSYVFTGLLAWTWFQTSLLQAVGVIRDNRQLIRQPGFPTATLPVVSVTSGLINFLMALPMLFVMILLEGVHFNLSLLALPLLITIQGLFTLSLAYFAAAVNVTFRDTQHLLAVLLQLLFFATPIFYSMDVVPERFHLFYLFNPLVHLLTGYREVLMHGVPPEVWPLAFITVLSMALLALGYGAFKQASFRFVEES